MSNRIKSLLILILLILFLAIINPVKLFYAILPDYQVWLSSKVSILRLNPYNYSIAGNENENLISGYITEIDIEGNIVFGYIKPNNGISRTFTPGYFIVDIEKETVISSLPEDRWFLKLKELGITREPRRKKNMFWWAVGIDRW